MPSPADQAVAAVWKREAARVISGLTRILRDVSLAEESAQDALVAALEHWPSHGVPENPGAWLMTTAKNRALNSLRRAKLAPASADPNDIEDTTSHVSLAEVEASLESRMDDDVADDVLRLVFTACHPLLTQEARVALTLRMIGGLSTEEIARAFLASEPTMAQRIVRAKKTLSQARVPFEVPRGDELSARLSSVLEVVYLIFNEGYTATAGDDLVRPALAEEALRLGALLAELAPAEPEVFSLVALMELHSSRNRARVDEEGEPVLLTAQDRSQWDRDAIARGLSALTRAVELAATAGRYQLQAEIAACHARASSVESTDWARIADRYAELGKLTPSPVIELNRAVAISRAEGPAAGLALLDGLAEEPVLSRYHLLPAARADLLEQLGRREEARAEFLRAASLATHPRQVQRLEQRALACVRGQG
jgi:RNA polymerase sigma factor (sigma-70 family)